MVAGLELGPFRGIVSEPLAELSAGSDLFQPQVNVSLFFGEATGPEAIYQDAGAIGFGGRFVDAFEFYRHCRRLGAVASVLHGGQLLGTGPGDGQQEGGIADGLDVMTDGGGEGEEIADVEIV